MKKKTARAKRHTRPTKRKTKSTKKRRYSSKGALGAGMVYAILALLVVLAAGSLMIGNIIPLSTKSPTTGQPVITIPVQNDQAKDNLQLFTFPGVTYTPTPTPTIPPQPQQKSPGGGSGGGSGGGGSAR